MMGDGAFSGPSRWGWPHTWSASLAALFFVFPTSRNPGYRVRNDLHD